MIGNLGVRQEIIDALVEIVRDNNCDELKDFLNQYPDIDLNNVRDAQGQTLLQVALDAGSSDVAEELIERKVDVNVVDGNGNTPLHTAALMCLDKVVKALIAAGVGVDILNHNGETPLHRAVKSRDYESVKALIAAGANVDAKDQYGDTPLHLAVKSRDYEIVKALIAAGVGVDILNHNGETPLHRAVKSRDYEIVKALIAAGAGVDILNREEKDPLDDEHIDINKLVKELIAEQSADSPGSEEFLKNIKVLKSILKITKKYCNSGAEADKLKLEVLQAVAKVLNGDVSSKFVDQSNSKEKLESVVDLSLGLYLSINRKNDSQNHCVSLSFVQYVLNTKETLKPDLKLKALRTFVSDFMSDPKLLSDNVLKRKFISAIVTLAKEQDVHDGFNDVEKSVIQLSKKYYPQQTNAKRVVETAICSTVLAVCAIVPMLIIGEALLQPYVIAFGALAAASVLVGLCSAAYVKVSDNRLVSALSKLSQENGTHRNGADPKTSVQEVIFVDGIEQSGQLAA